MSIQAEDQRRRLILMGLGAARDLRVMTDNFERELLAWSRREVSDSEMASAIGRIMYEVQNGLGDIILFRDDFVKLLPEHSLQELEDSLDRGATAMGETRIMVRTQRRAAQQAAADALLDEVRRADEQQEDSQSTID